MWIIVNARTNQRISSQSYREWNDALEALDRLRSRHRQLKFPSAPMEIIRWGRNAQNGK